MEKLATDIYSFRGLRENGFTYVDKTATLLPLCDFSFSSGQRTIGDVRIG